jgi:hypothetical protein
MYKIIFGTKRPLGRSKNRGKFLPQRPLGNCKYVGVDYDVQKAQFSNFGNSFITLIAR